MKLTEELATARDIEASTKILFVRQPSAIAGVPAGYKLSEGTHPALATLKGLKRRGSCHQGDRMRSQRRKTCCSGRLRS